MATLAEIVIDAQHPAALARFWAGVLDDYAVRDYDQAEIDRLAALGHTPETDPTVALDGSGPTWFFQQSGEPTTQRNRIHFDVVCRNREAEVHRLIELGARIREQRDGYTVMLDPEGNQFCVKESGV